MEKIATITLDMDELDVLAEGYGIKDSFKPAIYAKAVPRILALLDEVGVKASFYVITKDINNEESRSALKEISDCGHEIGNHSLNHNHLLNTPKEETRNDTVESTNTLSDIIGRKIDGYRGPSLTFNDYLMEILIELGYKYDTSVNPTFFFIGEWLFLYFTNSNQRNLPQYFFIKHALSRSTPYMISPPSFFKSSSKGEMVELPISHVPFLNVPFYATFHFLFPFTYPLFKGLYYKNKYLIYHAHALDFLDIEKDNIPSSFGKHPGMKLPWSEKRQYFIKLLREMKEKYSPVVTASEMADYIKLNRGMQSA